jgi:hypothetical protein
MDYNIKMDLKAVVSGSVNWICLAQDREMWRAVTNRIINFRISYNA